MADNFLAAARDTVRNQFCNVLAVADGALNYLRNIEQSMGTQVIDNPPLPADINGLIGVFCNMPPAPIPPEIPPQFAGGQCVGDRYRITASWTRNLSGGNTSKVIDAVGGQLYDGPISEVFILNGNDDVRVRHNFGQESDFLSGNPSSFTVSNLRDISVENVDNPADDCGSLPSTRPTTPPPGTDSPVNDNINVGPPGAEVPIPVAVGFGDVVVDVNGSLNVGFNLVNPEFNLTGNLNLTTGDINFNLGGRGPDNEECCLPPQIDDDDTDETGDDDDDETRSVIVGVLVNSVVDEPNFKGHIINQDNGPTIYHPRLANLYFRLRVEGQIFWTAPIKVKGTNQYIQCPADFGASSVVANPVSGVTLRLSPIRRRIPISEFP